MTRNIGSIVLEELDREGDLLALRGGEVRLAEFVESIVSDGPKRLPGLRGGGFATPRAVFVVVSQRLPAVPTGVASGRLSVVGINFARVGEDAGVHVLCADVDVRLPHIGVQYPSDAMLNLLFSVAFSPHSRDGTMPEVVGVDGLVNARPLGNLRETAVEVRRREAAVLFGVKMALGRVEERDIAVVGTRMRLSEIRPQAGLRVDDGIGLDGCFLQRLRVRVGGVRGCITVQINVTDTQRRGHADARARVREELDDSDISLVACRVNEGGDVVGVQHPAGVNRITGFVAVDHLVVFGPRVAVEPEEIANRLLVVAGSPEAHAVGVAPAELGSVAQVEDELVQFLVGQLGNRAVVELGDAPELREVVPQCRVLDAVGLLADESVDGLTVVLVVDVQLVKLSLEAVAESVDVVERHSNQSGRSPHNGKREKGVSIRGESTRKAHATTGVQTGVAA